MKTQIFTSQAFALVVFASLSLAAPHRIWAQEICGQVVSIATGVVQSPPSDQTGWDQGSGPTALPPVSVLNIQVKVADSTGKNVIQQISLVDTFSNSCADNRRAALATAAFIAKSKLCYNHETSDLRIAY